MKIEYPFIQLLHNFFFQFKSTDSERTRDSAKYFTIGLFGRHNSDFVQFPRSLEKDPILRVSYLFIFGYFYLPDNLFNTFKKHYNVMLLFQC